MRPTRAATLADVGRAAGVSAMAASAVLNGARTSARIAPETRSRILEAARKLRYRPNVAARALANRRMNTIGVAAIIDRGELNQYFIDVFGGVLDGAARHEQNTTVFAVGNWSKERERIASFCDGRIDGLILIAPVIDATGGSPVPEHTPCVTLHANALLPGVTNIESEDEAGSFAIVQHLISLGHRRIMHMAGPAGLRGPQARIAGYRRALESAGIAFDPSLVIQGDFVVSASRASMNRWLREAQGCPLPSALFCANDGSAIGCIEALAAAGLKVPDDISVAGFDDTMAARCTVPQLTTVQQPLHAMGVTAVDLLLAEITRRLDPDAALAPSNTLVLPTRVIERASVAPPAGQPNRPVP